MVLQHGAGVQGGQGGACLHQEGIVGASVVQIMAEAGHQDGEPLGETGGGVGVGERIDQM